MMAVRQLGYVGFGADNLAAWGEFATRQLGLQQVDRGAGSLAFRMDDRRQRIMAEAGTDERFFGWEVAGPAALDALAARLEANGVAVVREPAALADRRLVAGLVSCRDPEGNRVELFHGPMLADTPFVPGRDISGFRAGPLGLGHAVLMVRDHDRALHFYRDLLGFGISDYIRVPFKGSFLHVNPRHHSLAIFEAPRTGLHHLMMELCMLDDVGQAYDLALAAERVRVTLGRHANDLMTSFYMQGPSDFLVECGWGAREVTPGRWQAEELTPASLASFWGHEGLMRAVTGDPPPGAPPPPRPPEGRRAPVQVLAGAYVALAGECPWWGAATGRG